MNLQRTHKTDEFTDKGNMSLNVCMLTYSMPPEHSGAAKQAITLATQLAKNGVNILFLTQGCYAKNLKIETVSGFNIKRIYKETLFWKVLAPFRFFFYLYKKRNFFSIIHVHGVGYLAKIAVIFGIIFEKKVILKMTMFSEDDALSIKHGKNGAINFWFFSRASHYIAITSRFYESCLEANIRASKVSLIPNGVNTEIFYPVLYDQKQYLRNKLNLPLNKLILVYAGIIRPEKGIDFLLDTIERVSHSNTEAFLLILGPTEKWLPEKEQAYISEALQRMAILSDKGLLMYVGNVNNVNEYFQASDLFVSASHKEGLQNVLIEAMACGLPPVVINIADMHRAVLSDGNDGIIVDERDVDKFSLEIANLLDDKDKYHKISSAAVNKIRETYSINMVTKAYINLYNNLI